MLAFAYIIIFFVLFALAIAVLEIVASYKVFEKAGVEGWKSIIPIYNVYVMTKDVAKMNLIWFALIFASVIPYIGSLVSLFALVNIHYGIARRFTDKEEEKVLGAIFYGIYVFVIAFGKYEYNDATMNENGFIPDSSVDNVKNGFSSNNNTTKTNASGEKFCHNCGGKVNADDKFCQNCGTKLD